MLLLVERRKAIFVSRLVPFARFCFRTFSNPFPHETLSEIFKEVLTKFEEQSKLEHTQKKEKYNGSSFGCSFFSTLQQAIHVRPILSQEVNSNTDTLFVF